MPFPAPTKAATDLEPKALPQHIPLAAQTRGALVESIHYGSLVAVSGEATGTRTLLSPGDTSAPF